jgi:hypothetical protein
MDEKIEELAVWDCKFVVYGRPPSPTWSDVTPSYNIRGGGGLTRVSA